MKVSATLAVGFSIRHTWTECHLFLNVQVSTVGIKFRYLHVIFLVCLFSEVFLFLLLPHAARQTDNNRKKPQRKMFGFIICIFIEFNGVSLIT